MKTVSMLAGSLAAIIALSGSCDAQISDGVVKIGFLSDFSGYTAPASGKGSLDAARMAVEDFGGTVLGKPIEIVSADHQNKADVGLAIAREWLESQKVDVIQDVPHSPITLAIQNLTREKKKIFLSVSGGTSDFVGKACSPYGISWVYDTYALAAGVASAVTKRGGNSWYFVTVDYAFGEALERDMRSVAMANGAKMLGTVKHPLMTADLSSQLLQAQGSGAKVIGLANGAADVRNSIKQAHEFGISAKQQLAAALLLLTDVRTLGLESAQGTLLVEAFYWDLNDETRAFAKRYFQRNGAMPTMMQAGNYSATMNYLKAVQQAGTDDSDKVMATLRATEINDFMTKGGRIRADGKLMRDTYLFQIKSPSESKGEWDYYKLVATVPAEDAARSLADGGCPLVAPEAKR